MLLIPGGENMIVIGLTGGSGSGKGCVCKSFLRYGINAIDTDKTSREVCEKGKPCLNELVASFGDSILFEDGTLNRASLASIAFSDSDKLAVLNKITHYHILNEVRVWLDTQKRQGCRAAIVDAPLLFESGFDKECDVIVAVTAPREERIKRLLLRDGITRDAIELRLSKQHPDEFYTERSDFTITNNGSLEDVNLQADMIYRKLFPNNITE